MVPFGLISDTYGEEDIELKNDLPGLGLRVLPIFGGPMSSDEQSWPMTRAANNAENKLAGWAA